MWLQLFAVFLPALISIFAIRSARLDFAKNRRLFYGTAVLSAVLATPWVQPYLHLFGQPESDVVVPPLFVVLYIFFGRFDLPNTATAFAGTYFTLLLGDLASAGIGALSHNPWWKPFTWVGGARLLDGLFLMPIFAATAILFLTIVLKRGHSVSFMFGRHS